MQNMMYAEESRDWDYQADYPEMTVRAKFMAKESPAYFIDQITGEESDCRVIDLEATYFPIFYDTENKVLLDRCKKRCDEISSKGIAACEFVTDDAIYFVAVG